MGLRDKLRGVRDSVNEARAASNYQSTNYITYYAIPDGIGSYQPKPKKDGFLHKFNVVPFICGPGMPDKVYPNNPPKEGEPAFYVDLHVHSNIGPNNETIICPTNSYKRGKCFSDEEALKLGKVKDESENIIGCPVCKKCNHDQAKLPGPENKERRTKAWKTLSAKRRCLYEVSARNDEELDPDDLAVMDFTFGKLQKHLNEKSDPDSETFQKGSEHYPDPDVGKEIRMKLTLLAEKTEDKPPSWEFGEPFFADREDGGKPYDISDKLLEQTFPLDSCLNRKTYGEIYEALYQRPWHLGAPEGDEVNEEKQEEPPKDPPSRSRRRKEEEQSPEEEKQEEPPKRRRRTEEPEKQEVKNNCPEDYEWGTDCLKKTGCENCPEKYYEPCEAEFKRLQENKPKRLLRR